MNKARAVFFPCLQPGKKKSRRLLHASGEAACQIMKIIPRRESCTRGKGFGQISFLFASSCSEFRSNSKAECRSSWGETASRSKGCNCPRSVQGKGTDSLQGFLFPQQGENGGQVRAAAQASQGYAGGEHDRSHLDSVFLGKGFQHADELMAVPFRLPFQPVRQFGK